MPSGQFSPATIAFLRGLKQHNDRVWFEQNRNRYETHLLQPCRDLATQLAPVLQLIDFSLETRPQVGKTISRIYRDTRFSKNKLPFRDHFWLEFRDKSLSSQAIPSFFFYLEIEEWGYGMGFWQAGAAAMERIRSRIQANPQQGQKLLKELFKTGHFTLGGEKYKRLQVVDLPKEALDLYNYKSFYFIHRQPINPQLFSAGLAEEISEGFLQLAPLYHYVVGL